ncbi:MAG: hypothetical protein ACJASL_001665 [Paraglaciecola sp.]|jgi:hypothetical protein
MQSPSLFCIGIVLSKIACPVNWVRNKVPIPIRIKNLAERSLLYAEWYTTVETKQLKDAEITLGMSQENLAYGQRLN